MSDQPLDYEPPKPPPPASAGKALRLAAFAIAFLAGAVLLGSGVIAGAISSRSDGSDVEVVGALVMLVAGVMFILELAFK